MESRDAESLPASRSEGGSRRRDAAGRIAPADPQAFVGSRIDPERRRGRGATLNPVARYDTIDRQEEDDGWGSLGELPPFQTEVTVERPRTIITRNDSPDISFDRSVNPYRGCEHGCVYCFARPTHAYMGLSPGVDFESKLLAKPEAAALLAKELSSPGYKAKTIAIGTNTDAYQPIEKKMRIMRGVLETLAEFNHPVGIVTKSSLVERDIDLLAPMAARGLAKVAVSVTTLDLKLARTMEPRAASPTKRLETLRRLNEAGIPTTVLVAPIIPAINEHEIERILEAAYARRLARGGLCAAEAAARGEGPRAGLAADPLSRQAQAGDVAGARDARGQGLRPELRPAAGRHRPPMPG